MSEHSKQPRLYEWIDTEDRFVRMADVIIANSGVATTSPSLYAPQKLVALWNSPTNEHTFRVAYTDKGESGGKEYLLEKYHTTGPVSIATERYFVKKHRGELTPLEQVDDQWRPIVLTDEQKQAAAHSALSILTSRTHKDSSRILRDSIDRRFPEVAAVFAMSDLATTGDVVTEASAHEQKAAFTKKMGEFETLMGRAATKENGYFDQELHYNLYHGPEPDGRNSFRDFDLRAAMVAVAKSVGSSWQNRIDTEHQVSIEQRCRDILQN